ncbi:hypothetical protein ACFVS2_20095 [Brevibacillus sp. NPDC058079]|uniref:hypothetical protein n=1 Tax=Brevibacillus sp. NPDC058079 TaxID=3346330 RepID=UPI0036F18E33
MQTGGKKLFRLTMQRKMILSRIISTIRNKIESVELGLQIIEKYPDEEIGKEARMKAHAELTKLMLYHDVIETVVSHNDDYDLEIFRYEKRAWNNESEIPIDLFREAIHHFIDLLEFYKKRTLNEKHKKSKDQQIDLLRKLLTFREESVAEKHLFRMTIQRKILLENILSEMKIKIDSTQAIIVSLIERISDENRKNELLKEAQAENKKWKLNYDVLKTVSCHNDEFLLNMHRHEDRGWSSEIDIPADVFRTAILETIDLFELYKQSLGKDEYKKKKDKQIAFLRMLLTYHEEKIR